MNNNTEESFGSKYGRYNADYPVVSVLLAGVVTYFAINVTSTRVQEESLQLTKLHVWCPQATQTDAPQAAFLIINTGGRDVVINKITIRGQTANMASSGSQHVCYAVTGKSVTEDLNYILDVDALDQVPINNSTSDNLVLTRATSDITLASGNSMVIYIASPDSISINDIDLTVGITVFTSQAMYYQEANVQAYVPA